MRRIASPKPALRDWDATKLEVSAQRAASDLSGSHGARARALKGWVTRYAAQRFRVAQKGLL